MNEAASEKSPVQPQQLQQFQEALKNLASKLPPGFVPPDLSSVPPDQLRKAMENPAIQQQMKQMLEQFAKDGVLPKPGDNGSQLPVPPQNDASQNDGGQNDGSEGEFAKERITGKQAEPIDLHRAHKRNRTSLPKALSGILHQPMVRQRYALP
jgi:hypothetical protein